MCHPNSDVYIYSTHIVIGKAQKGFDNMKDRDSYRRTALSARHSPLNLEICTVESVDLLRAAFCG